MSEMIDRVARAICEAEATHDWAKVSVQPAETWSLIAYYRKTAQHAIAAMREPTEAMMGVGKFKCHGVDIGDGSMRTVCGGFLGETSGEQWCRMIDAALEGGE